MLSIILIMIYNKLTITCSKKETTGSSNSVYDNIENNVNDNLNDDGPIS